MMDWEQDTLTASFYLAESHGPDSEPELLAMVKDRMRRMLADKLATALGEATGGAIYSPITYTIREADDLGGYQVVGTVQVQRFPDPESEYFGLVDGPMHGASVKLGAYPPERMPIRVVRPWVIPSDPAMPEMVIYERIPGVQAYRYAGR